MTPRPILPAATLATPLGEAWVCATDDGICALGLGPRAEPILSARVRRRFPAARIVAAPRDRDLAAVGARLSAYFSEMRPLDGVPLDLGGTAFQARVWALLRAIPLGARVSYAELAARLGRPTAVRAVARANATNPVSLLVPCHRVVGADGALRGYAWGAERKAWLLAHEARSKEPGIVAAARALTSRAGG